MTSFIGFVRSGSRVKRLKSDRGTGLKLGLWTCKIISISGQKWQALLPNLRV